jgi:hypothetical protein
MKSGTRLATVTVVMSFSDVVGGPGLGGTFELPLVREAGTLLSAITGCVEDGDGDRNKDSDNENNDHQLDEGEALITLPEHPHVPHLLLPFGTSGGPPHGGHSLSSPCVSGAN